MRVLVISSCPEQWGGSEELWCEAALTLRARGHRVDVLRLSLDRAHPRVAALIQSGCRVEVLSHRGERLAVALSAVLSRGPQIDARRYGSLVAAAVIARRRPDLVIVSQGQNYDGLNFAHMCRRLRVPYIVISQKAAEEYWPPDAVRRRHHLAHTAAAASIFVSEHNRRVTEDQLGPIPCARVMRNPVLLGHDGPLAWPAGDAPLRLACVARLNVPEKGQDALLRVLARPQWRERPVELTFFGSGWHAEGLAALAGRLELSSVRFAGSVPDIAEVWRTHHLLVLPSRTEGLPLALVEAMMLGRPAVVTDVGGNAEVIDDGVTGFIASGPGLDALDAALERAWVARAEWAEIGRRAAERIRELNPDGPGEAGARLADLVQSSAR
jgi:glycosyltransferase involved in cell wall biosynthesis